MDDKDLINEIKSILEKYKKVRFVHNGRTIEGGLDCLGFILLFYREFGIYLPSDDGRPIEEDWYKKEPDRYINSIKKLKGQNVKLRELKALDLVYFSISREIITHSGIMTNNKEFAHMSPKSNFLISKMERHWLNRYRGAVRFDKV